MLSINKAGVRDADAVVMIENECFAHPWKKEDVLSAMERADSIFLTAAEDGKVVGYIGGSLILDEAYVYDLAVLPGRRKRGAGSALLESFIEEARRRDCAFVSLEVRPSNTAAVSLYKKHGFSEAGRRRDFYRDPVEDALIMTKYLKEK